MSVKQGVLGATKSRVIQTFDVGRLSQSCLNRLALKSRFSGSARCKFSGLKSLTFLDRLLAVLDRARFDNAV